ncbi:helix-turn-helix domain-containing protein [Clostridium massiliodielmoense]|uniref:helix-turn-helix domain-containing protein n=1 Tax=Clostridium massiliodielmoense TaxID=1776385 RepID=UPI000A26FB15|nr:helix-turn-helix domain-containing protein [Clostridium massiliodielmoense]
MKLTDVMNLKEASEKYNINMNTLKTICQRSKYDLVEEVDFRKSGKVWLITKDAMKKILEKKGK